MARTYKRDSRGRFAGGGGSSGGSRPKPKAMQRGANRLTRNNAGRITSVGGAGATARGGRLRTASGKKRATVTTKISGGRSGVVGKPKGLKPGAVKVKAEAKALQAGVNAKSLTTAKSARRIDYSGAVKQLNRQAAARKRVNSPQQTFNGNANYSRAFDLRIAKSSPMQNAAYAIRAARGDLRRAQATVRNPYVSEEMKARYRRNIPKMRKQVVSAVRIARAFQPANASETKRRYLASRAKK